MSRVGPPPETGAPEAASPESVPAETEAPGVAGGGRLIELSVRDLALIERVRLELEPGFNVLTGETGAGKSLLIDALGLVLGGRADPGLVRHGAAGARVEALFDAVPEPRIAVRELTAGGRSTARLDDETVTAARLGEAIGPFVEVHGQHDQQRLLDERWQRDLLDAFGDLGDVRATVAEAVERWRTNRAALAALAIEPRELARRIEIARHEAAEIEAAHLRVGEAAGLEARLAAAQHGEAIARGAQAIQDALTGEGTGARETVALALREAHHVGRLDPRFEALAERLAGAEAEVADIAAEARLLADGIDHDPTALAALEERLSTILGLERRYGDDEAAVIAHGERAAAEVDRLGAVDVERARRQADDGRLLAEVAVRASDLSGSRRVVGEALTGSVGSALEALGFPAGVFEVALGRRPAAPDEPAVEVDGDALTFDATGIDQVIFRLAPNPGEPARPLSKIASGGELSRVALAIKEVLATADRTPTLVFDEIDTGIGGRSADPVGRSLWSLARRHQVLCVTHLPQIAAHADAHFQIAKRERDGRTITEVRRLDRDGRIAELAEMLAGAEGGAAALAGARELLDRAEAWRAGSDGSG